MLTNRIDPPKPLTDINGQLVDMRNPLGWGDLSETPKRVMPPVAADD
ncbi:MAG TPA: hypothetical protein VFY26_04015 [Anaerolineales bacterium]|nr:hypothetical protein [Anaerolineales bacterium]